MTRARRIAAIAFCVVLIASVVAQLNGNLDLPRTVKGLTETTHTASGSDGTNQSASALPRLNDRTARLMAAQRLLSARAAAVRARSKNAWMATVDPLDSPFRARQSVMFDNLIKLPLGEFSYGAVDTAPELSPIRAEQVGPRAWAATVTGIYWLTGYDRAPQSYEATYTFVQGAGGWRIADDTDGATALQMWDLPGMRVIRDRSGIVIGNAPVARMRDYGAIADQAVSRITGVWGTGWNSHVVLVTPSTSDEFVKLLRRSADEGLDQVAAITQGVIEPGQRAKGDRVVINPQAFTALQPIGRRVVIVHELTHVAARSSTTSPVPIWLNEGMADYVGYSGLGLPRQRVAAELLTLVRAGKVPTGLPTEVDFDPSRTTIAPSYSESWLAVSRLVDLYGQKKVVAFYRAVATPQTGAAAPDPDAAAVAAFPRSFGVSEAHFVQGWRQSLTALSLAPR